MDKCCPSTRARGVGSIKRWGGGAPASRGTLRYRKGRLKIFYRNVGNGEGEENNFPVVPYRNCTFLTKFFKKLGNFQTKRASLMLI
jgi:hypothetical protein